MRSYKPASCMEGSLRKSGWGVMHGLVYPKKKNSGIVSGEMGGRAKRLGEQQAGIEGRMGRTGETLCRTELEGNRDYPVGKCAYGVFGTSGLRRDR